MRLFLSFDQVSTAASKSKSFSSGPWIEIRMQLLRVPLVISLRSLVLIRRIDEKALSQSAVLIGSVKHTSANLQKLG